MKVNLVTLGCSKNLVDSEKLLYQLQKNGHSILHNSNEYTEAVIINTCGFILDAKTESIENILNYVEAKKQGFIGRVVVMGCLSERYRSELKTEIPELDGIFGVNEQEQILASLESRYYQGELYIRSLQTPSHYAYLKISEGCDRRCAFCAIPGIRGKQVSVPIPELTREAGELASAGVKELILIAQELTSYGTDIYRKKALPELLEELVKINGIEWIRLHYTYPLGFPTGEIVQLMKKHRKICRYLDIPVQHISDRVLKSMKRGHGAAEIYEIINTFRKEIPGIAVRSTLISGYPGETSEDHKILKEFVREIKFDRLGVFSYSHEEGTSAYSELEDDIQTGVKETRLREIMDLQQVISLENNQNKIGSLFRVIIDGREGDFYTARTEFDSPEVDNEVLIPAEDPELTPGEFYTVKIYDATEYDLYGRVV